MSFSISFPFVRFSDFCSKVSFFEGFISFGVNDSQVVCAGVNFWRGGW